MRKIRQDFEDLAQEAGVKSYRIYLLAKKFGRKPTLEEVLQDALPKKCTGRPSKYYSEPKTKEEFDELAKKCGIKRARIYTIIKKIGRMPDEKDIFEYLKNWKNGRPRKF